MKKDVYILFLLLLAVSSCYKEEAVDNDYSVPVEIAITNLSRGADRCEWTFEGGNPAACEVQHPALIRYDIPGAIKTYAVNDLEKSNLSFTLEDFDVLENDAPLLPLDIRANDTGNLYFELNRFPRLILFQTNDGRKGAVKITKAADAGTDSYIEADIKIQKEKR